MKSNFRTRIVIALKQLIKLLSLVCVIIFPFINIVINKWLLLILFFIAVAISSLSYNDLKNVKFARLFYFPVISIFISCFIINYFTMIDVYWKIFTTFLFFIIFLLFSALKYFVIDSKKLYSMQLSQNYIILLTIFFIACDFFFIANFKFDNTGIFITGGILALIILLKLLYAFTNSYSKSKIILLFDFLFLVALTVFLIHKIQDTKLTDIITAIVSAIYGGLMTLAGVILTINDQKKDKKESRQLSVLPYFNCTPYICDVDGNNKLVHYVMFKSTLKLSDTDNADSKKSVVLKIGYILNTDKVEFTIKKVVLDCEEYLCFEDSIIYKNELFMMVIYVDRDNMKEYQQIQLVVEDIDRQLHKYNLIIDNGQSIPLIKNIELVEEDDCYEH